MTAAIINLRTDLHRQRIAVASLVGECEALVSSGCLTDPAEQSLRLLIAETCQAFDMPSIAERPDDGYDRLIQLMAQEMANGGA